MQKVVGSNPITRSTNVPIKIDFHNHTIHSHDSINQLRHFEQAYQRGWFDVIAITDHNQVDAALLIKEKASFPVIVGEEITTQEGDVIGLFLHEIIPPDLTTKEAAQRIKDQGGLVYIPHPFDRLKVGMNKETLLSLGSRDLVDLVECYNDAFQTVLFSWSSGTVHDFIKKNNLVAAAGSDSHIPRDIGQAYVEVDNKYDPSDLASNPSLLMEAVRDGTVVGTTRFSILSVMAKTYGHFRRKLIQNPHL